MFNQFAFYSEIIFKTGAVLYLFIIILYGGLPFYEYFFHHQLVTILPYLIPGINSQTIGGYTATTIFQGFGLCLGYFGIAASDLLYCMIVVNTPLMKNLIEIEVIQLNNVLNSKKPDILQIRFKLRNIILMYIEMQKYITLYN